MRPGLLLGLLLGLLACQDKAVESADAFCADAPTVTWESHTEALLTQWCQPCHASDAANRHDAPASVTFDTEDDAVRWAERIQAVATGDAPTMPPSIELPEEDLLHLEVWLRCEVGVGG